MENIVKKRIGNTLVFRFELTTNGQVRPLEGRDLILFAELGK